MLQEKNSSCLIATPLTFIIKNHRYFMVFALYSQFYRAGYHPKMTLFVTPHISLMDISIFFKDGRKSLPPPDLNADMHRQSQKRACPDQAGKGLFLGQDDVLSWNCSKIVMLVILILGTPSIREVRHEKGDRGNRRK